MFVIGLTSQRQCSDPKTIRTWTTEGDRASTLTARLRAWRTRDTALPRVRTSDGA
jgi:hypothetical protein